VEIKQYTQTTNGSKKKLKEKLGNVLRQVKIDTQYIKLWNAAKAVPRGKFIALNTYIKEEKRSQINNLVLYLKELENE
jgi:hypothetical protein